MALTNEKISAIFAEIGEYLAMQNIPFKPRAYQKVAEAIESLEEPVEDIYKKGGLKAIQEIPGVGESIGEKIEELILTGKIAYHEKLKIKIPVDLASLTRVPGLGPKSIRTLYQKLGIKNLKDLENAARAGNIRELEGFGSRKEEKILKNIAFAETAMERVPLGHVMPLIREIENRFKNLKYVDRVEVAGSARRRKETIGDIDILVISEQADDVMEYVSSMSDVTEIIGRGGTKTSVRISNEMQLDVRVVPRESYGAALNYFTGSKDHNVAMRKVAVEKGYKLNEYGLFKGKKIIARREEEDIYKALGLEYIEPELRENSGEIDASRKKSLPKLIGYNEILGDLQVQTDWSDGANSIYEMAVAAKSRGLKYLVVTDHTKNLTVAGGLDEKRLKSQWAEIDKVNKKMGGTFRVLKGTECDILKDGSLDLSDEALGGCDVVGISVHSYFDLPEKEQTERIVRAMENPNADILFHPTGRVLGKRKAIDLDMDFLMARAKRTGTVLEINSFPDRLDLKDEYIRKCVEMAIPMSIDTDAHSEKHFELLEYGISQARRGWAEKKDIVNAWPVKEFLSRLKK